MPGKCHKWPPAYLFLEFIDLFRLRYGNILTYLEDYKNYLQLYGNGSNTLAGVTSINKAAAYKTFSIFINYQETYCLKNTGAGIKEYDGGISLAENLECMCSHDKWMDTILDSKHNISPLGP
ncbi:uncharacterized protein VP01_2785g1 [Puccinia sorghi]|uniref:Uncharacterized protein n=1 Tax=Puccinia sorghi TaxID=27349 RepID=A0A0L6V2Q4_9BASI|nr:uncharacterized protein VP01_2785g1 [Puccinia sorghi]